MSAGTGVVHSEYNASRQAPVHYLQIWIQPDRRGIAPSYEQKTFSQEDKAGRLRLVASPDGGDGSVTLHADARLYAGVFAAGGVGGHALAPGVTAGARGARPGQNGVRSAGDAVVLTSGPSDRRHRRRGGPGVRSGVIDARRVPPRASPTPVPGAWCSAADAGERARRGGAAGIARALVLTTPAQTAHGRDVIERLGYRIAGMFSGAMMHTPVEVTNAALELARGRRRRGRDRRRLDDRAGQGDRGDEDAAGGDPTTYAGSEMTPILGETEAARRH
jgi:hypothetical protein